MESCHTRESNQSCTSASLKRVSDTMSVCLFSNYEYCDGEWIMGSCSLSLRGCQLIDHIFSVMSAIFAFHYKFHAREAVPKLAPTAKIVKRKRNPVSCLPCRTKKWVSGLSAARPVDTISWLTVRLRCDRAQPCNNCSKRDLSSGCSYAMPATAMGGSAHERLYQLQSLIVDLGQSESSGSSNNYVRCLSGNCHNVY